MLTTDIFDTLLAIPESQNDKDNELFFFKIKDKNMFFICLSLTDNHNFVMFSTSYDLCKDFIKNEITIREAITDDSVFYSLTLNESGIQYFKNENNIDMESYNFNHSDISVTDKTFFDQHENLNHILEANMECFY